MDPLTYATEARTEATHWWFVVRRRLFARIIAKSQIAKDAAILDLGTSTGTNLRMLRDHGFTNVTGVDLSRQAIEYCRDKGFNNVIEGDICELPLESESFDLVLATDIIEHVPNEDKALSEICRVVKVGGSVLITVPAFQGLWGLQDEVSHHMRRYRKAELLKKIAITGMTIRKAYYFNFLLFAPIWLARQTIRALELQYRSENDLGPAWSNRVLKWIFEIDCRLAPILHPPLGVSILVFAERCQNPQTGG